MKQFIGSHGYHVQENGLLTALYENRKHRW